MLKEEYENILKNVIIKDYLIEYLGINYLEYEKNTRELIIPLIENKKDWYFFDCGAQAGIYSILFSLCAQNGKVICFEPTITYNALKRNMKFLQNKKVIPDNYVLEKIAVGNKTGIYKEEIWRLWQREKIKDDYYFTTLDDYVIKNNLKGVDFVKIDVDSYDMEVLEGMTKIIEKYSPIILVEVNSALLLRGYKQKDVLDFMKIQGYKDLGHGESNILWKK